ncbi:MAG: ATP-dependent 6-phosphofructokinase [Sphingomonadales bacterium]|jgi:6-phosphofructokinase 1
MPKRIGILTGGGDVPGLNACIRAIVEGAVARGWEVIGFRRGWAGPLSIDPLTPWTSENDHYLKLNVNMVRTIDRSGGTVLHTSRIDPRRINEQQVEAFGCEAHSQKNEDGSYDASAHVLAVLDALGVDAMVTMGGDGTLKFTAYLSGLGVPVIAVPKTMDNDVFGTEYCIGFSTAITRSVDAITALRTTVSSHERVGVIELFGRRSGETALMAGYLSQADRVVIAEVPVDLDELTKLLVKDRAASENRYSMMVVSEGAHVKGAEAAVDIGVSASERKIQGIGRHIADYIKTSSGHGVVLQELAYLMRSGAPDALDKMVAMAFGTLAIQLLENGQSALMTALVDGNYEAVPVENVALGCKVVDVKSLYDVESYRPKIASILHKPMFLY